MSARPDAASPGGGAPELGAMIRALKRDPQAWRILLACTLAAVVTVFEPGYLTLSTSLIQAGLRAPNSPAPLILAAAFLVLALITLLAGTSADVFGRRKFLVVGLAGVTVSNVLGLSWLGTPQLFVFADLLTTVFGVIVLPAAIAIVTLAFEPALRPFAYGVLFGVQGAALVVSTLLVPLFGNVWDGRAAFVPVLVLGVVALRQVQRHVPESRAPASLHRGTIVLNLVFVAGLFTLLFLIVTNGIRTGESLLALAAAAFLLLVADGLRVVARKSPHFAGIEIYGGRDLGMAVLAGLMLMFAQGCFFYQIYPFFLDVQQVGVVAIAFRYVPYVVGLMAGGLVVARVLLRFGPQLILVSSFLLMGVALLGLSALKVDSPFWVMIVPITLAGFATGLGGPARTTVIMGGRPPGVVNGSSAVNTAAGQSGYALGVIISSVLVTQHADRLFVDGLRIAGIPPDIVAKVVTALESTGTRLLAARYPELPGIVRTLTDVPYANAFTSGMTRMFFVVAIAMFVTALAMFVGMRRRPHALR